MRKCKLTTKKIKSCDNKNKYRKYMKHLNKQIHLELNKWAHLYMTHALKLEIESCFHNWTPVHCICYLNYIKNVKKLETLVLRHSVGEDVFSATTLHC